MAERQDHEQEQAEGRDDVLDQPSGGGHTVMVAPGDVEGHTVMLAPRTRELLVAEREAMRELSAGAGSGVGLAELVDALAEKVARRADVPPRPGPSPDWQVLDDLLGDVFAAVEHHASGDPADASSAACQVPAKAALALYLGHVLLGRLEAGSPAGA